MKEKRVILLIIDACGVGELPDAADYGDVGSATIPNIAKAVGGLNMPSCQKLGLGNITPINGIPPADQPLACFGKMAEKSPGKDSTTGHWEIGGVLLEQPFPLFPNGFPPDVVEEFQRRTGTTVIGNIPASGTEIIRQLGERHLKTGEIILYTSADSVFQLAAHDSVVPLERLYDICQTARVLLAGEYAVARVIARPFTGTPGNFVRTSGRKDFSLTPPADTIIDLAHKNDTPTLAVGKTFDLYAQRGFSDKIKTTNNDEVMAALVDAARNNHEHQLIVANCVDFDMLWGHRNDTDAFAAGLERFDTLLTDLLAGLRDSDLLMITADHGCDPTIKSSTDHTREYVPLLVYGKNITGGVNLGTRMTFSDAACTIADYFALEHQFPGKSFMKEIRR